jgi:hypothetical protein
LLSPHIKKLKLEHLRHITNTLHGRNAAKKNFGFCFQRQAQKPEHIRLKELYTKPSWIESHIQFNEWLEAHLLTMVDRKDNSWPVYDRFEAGYNKLEKFFKEQEAWITDQRRGASSSSSSSST